MIFHYPAQLKTWAYRLLVLAPIVLLTLPSNSAETELTWTEPTLNEDGSPLTDLTSYDIWYGCDQSGVYDTVETLGAPATSYTVTGLPDGETCYFAGKAVNSQGESSVYSNEAAIVLDAVLPGAVTDTAITWQEGGDPTVTTFSQANSQVDYYSDPASITVTAPTEGNLLIVLLTERAGTGSTAHTVTDDNSNVWTAHIRHDQELGDSQARHSFSVWSHVATATDAAGTIALTGDDGTSNSKTMSIYEIEPSAAYDFTFATQASNDTGTGSTSPVSTGTASAPGAADAFVFGVGSWRRSSTFGAISFTNLDSAGTDHNGSSNQIAQGTEFYTTGQSDASVSSSVSWMGGAAEGGAGILTFTDGAVGGDDLLADDIESASNVDTPAIGQVHGLNASDIESASQVDTPAIGQVHGLNASDIESASQVSAPVLAASGADALLADDIESASEVDTPVIGQEHALLATAIESASEVDTPVIGQEHALLATAIESASEVGAPVLAELGPDALLAEDIESISLVSSPALDGGAVAGNRQFMQNFI